MKALSIQQPWAWLIVNASAYPDPKRIENRTWRTGFRGYFLVHAGKKFDWSGYESILEHRPDLKSILPAPGEFERGGLVGVAYVADCVDRSDSMWFTGMNGFVLEGAIPQPFMPLRGALGFFDVDIGDPEHPYHDFLRLGAAVPR